MTQEQPPIVLVGLPGSGKSATAHHLGARLGRQVFQLDPLIESRAGMSIAEVFQTDGEERFRELETDALEWVLTTEPTAIIDGGGGLVVRPANRLLLRRRAVTVWLDATDDVLLDRLGPAEDRPLLANGSGSVGDRLASLRSERLGHYSSAADAIVITAGLTEEQVAEQVEEALHTSPGSAVTRMMSERVELGDGRSYPVHIGRGVLTALSQVIPSEAGRVAVITQEPVGVAVDTGREQKTFIVEDGEAAKRLDVVADLTSELARWGLTRRDAIVSVGGGVVSDLAGFVASVYHRGVPVIHVPTTLLGQIDAAIGGKCGVNLPEGKNLVGSFWQPAAVLCDIDTLDSLPPREFRSGMGELAKYHFLGGGQLDRLDLVKRVASAVRIKADVVGGDEREGGRRAILNYGHTLAHALETAGQYDLRHGEAVGIGLVYAAELARLLGRIDAARVDEHRRVVAAYGLDAGLPEGADVDELIELFGRDKKAVDGVTFVLDGPRGVESVAIEHRQLLVEAFAALADPSPSVEIPSDPSAGDEA